MHPPRRLLRNAAFVLLGGIIGTFLRAGLDVALTGGELSTTTLLACNVVGSLALGFLLRALELSPRAATEGVQRLRLFAGTGIIGGFTSYSSFAFVSGSFATAAVPIAGIFYALLTVVSGVAAALIGTMIVPGSRRHDIRQGDIRRGGSGRA